jgi:prepilin-type N-terminal cleavage/methylation domain-containing protein
MLRSFSVKRRARARGFGLVEILIVLVVVAVAGAVLYKYFASSARTVEQMQEQRPIATAKVAADHGFTYGDVRTTFTGHEICSGSSWLHSVEWFNIGESYHPTAGGQSGGYLPVLAGAA